MLKTLTYSSVSLKPETGDEANAVLASINPLGEFMRRLALLALVALAAPVPAADAPSTARIVVGGGMSIAVPKGWTACDAPTRALLGSKEPTTGFAKQFCDQFDAKGGAKAVGDPNPADTLTLSMAFTPGQNLPGDLTQSATPDKLADLAAKTCADDFGPDTPAANCSFRIETVAERPALVGVLRDTKSGKAIRTVMQSVNGGTTILIFYGTHVTADGRVQAILDSVTAGPP
ncbi:MAG TPA: hypothetical protein VGF56_06270 [Rhizomicrobium sp.]